MPTVRKICGDTFKTRQNDGKRGKPGEHLKICVLNMTPELEKLAKVIVETRQAALTHLSVNDPYRAGMLAASARITFELASKLPSDIAKQFIIMVGF